MKRNKVLLFVMALIFISVSQGFGQLTLSMHSATAFTVKTLNVTPPGTFVKKPSITYTGKSWEAQVYYIQESKYQEPGFSGLKTFEFGKLGIKTILVGFAWQNDRGTDNDWGAGVLLEGQFFYKISENHTLTTGLIKYFSTVEGVNGWYPFINYTGKNLLWGIGLIAEAGYNNTFFLKEKGKVAYIHSFKEFKLYKKLVLKLVVEKNFVGKHLNPHGGTFTGMATLAYTF